MRLVKYARICDWFSLYCLQELELRIETQKQTLQARDESIKKLLEMLQNKGVGKFVLLVLACYFNKIPLILVI